MFLQGYFYWCGVIVNVMVVFWMIFGAFVVAKHWAAEKRIREKYAKKDIGGK